MKKLNYKYKVKLSDLNFLFNEIRFQKYELWNHYAKVEIAKILERVSLGKLKPENGYITISGSSGDKIKNSIFNIKLEKIITKENKPRKIKEYDYSDAWWNK